MKFLLGLALACFCRSVWAEGIWICTDLDSGQKTYTAQPVQRDAVECREALFERGSFQRKAFPVLGSPSNLSKHGGGRRARLNRLVQEENSFVPTTSWTAKQLKHKAPGERLQTRCLLSGQASSEQAGIAEIRVRRASVTIDKRRIVFGRGVAQVHWKMDLKGKCMNPRVEIVPIMISL